MEAACLIAVPTTNWLAGQTVDLSAPWYRSLSVFTPLLQQASQQDDWRPEFTAAARQKNIGSANCCPLTFVAPGDAQQQPYEEHIAATGRVPSRDNWHDLFNALMWLRLPRLKRALNALQARELATQGISNRRGPARDAATLLDENGLLLATADSHLFKTLCDALAQRHWNTLLLQQRQQWHQTVFVLPCGHALLDKLSKPYKAITAHVLPLLIGGDPLDEDNRVDVMDTQAAQHIECQGLWPANLFALPVLGIPGWWPANECAEFYQDASVFRRAGQPHVRSNGKST